MKKRFSMEQIVAGLKQAEPGLPVAKLSPGKAVLQDVPSNIPRPALAKEVMAYAVASHGTASAGPTC